MPYNPEIHHRRSIRLPEYDYSQEGLYFVTICVHNRKLLFGKIIDDIMLLNDAGLMLEKWFNRCTEHFKDIECLEKIIMPNHIHCIWHNTGEKQDTSKGEKGEHTGSPLHHIVQWFKTMTTNEYIRGVKEKGWVPFEEHLWQRNYYEHIIRNQQSYEEISCYIIENPIHWHDDELFCHEQSQ